MADTNRVGEFMVRNAGQIQNPVLTLTKKQVQEHFNGFAEGGAGFDFE